MIPFFRKIRKKMADDNQFFKYSRYAIGEITLVVVGILIALYINNWNEERKERKTEHLVLTEIRENLIYDLKDFEDNITNLNNRLTSCRILLEAFDKNLPYHDSLGYCFSYLTATPHLTVKTNGYKLLQSKGLGILKNNKLRNQITTLYENSYPYLMTYENEIILQKYGPFGHARVPYSGTNNMPQNLIPKSLSMKGNVSFLFDIGYFMDIRNYEQLKGDKDMHSMIKEIETWSYALGTLHGSVRENVIELIEQIETEL